MAWLELIEDDATKCGVLDSSDLAQYVELEVRDGKEAADKMFPDVAGHLAQKCVFCADEHGQIKLEMLEQYHGRAAEKS